MPIIIGLVVVALAGLGFALMCRDMAEDARKKREEKMARIARRLSDMEPQLQTDADRDIHSSASIALSEARWHLGRNETFSAWCKLCDADEALDNLERALFVRKDQTKS